MAYHRNTSWASAHEELLNKVNHAVSTMPATQLFEYEATIEETLVCATIESSSIVEALRLVNSLHKEAEQVTVKKIKQNSDQLSIVTNRQPRSLRSLSTSQVQA